jgi:hypothetical protein
MLETINGLDDFAGYSVKKATGQEMEATDKLDAVSSMLYFYGILNPNPVTPTLSTITKHMKKKEEAAKKEKPKGKRVVQ